MTPEQKIVTLGNKLSIAATMLTFVGTLVMIVIAWGKFDTRMVMVEHRVERLERMQSVDEARARTDHDILVELRGDVKAMTSTVQQLKGAVERLDDRSVK